MLASAPLGRLDTVCYFAFINATVVSSIRFENPHSLSYQEHTFTRVPSDTLVRVESNIDEDVLWLKSTDTNGASLYSRMPLSAPIALFFTSASATDSRFSRRPRCCPEASP